jgi:acyl-CoA synthetase (AMP-forming)/AMP-acid ligase II
MLPPNRSASLRDHLINAADRAGFLFGAASTVSPGDLLGGTSLGGRLAELSGRSILLTARDQLAAALAVIELDGVARRIVICTPDISSEHLPSVIAKAGVDAIVSDYELDLRDYPGSLLRVVCSAAVAPGKVTQVDTGIEQRHTEWVLLSSGTTGAPKMIVHTLASLTAPIGLSRNDQATSVVWGTFYDIRRYGGLQIFLRAILGNGSLVLSSAAEPVSSHLERLAAHGVTHLSGTPSHWRRALMSPQAHAIAPRYVRLSGEIADQAILNTLRAFYPNAAVGHAFATTEAGVAFEVNDCLAGFPASLPGTRGEVEMKIGEDSLRIRSNRTAIRYLDGENGVLADEEGFVDTGDIVEQRGDRYYFLGRRNGVINVGGLKVYPEEVEAVINRHPAVRMSMVQSRRNPITGALVAADVVLTDVAAGRIADFRNEILELCRQNLAAHKIPATIRSVISLEVAPAGKLVRSHA